VVGKTNLGGQASGFYVTPSTLHIASSTVSQISFEDYIITAAIAIANNTFAFGHQNASPSYEFKHSNTYNGNYATTGTTFARFNPTTSYISSGNVGIGTTAPQAPLHVIAASNTNDALIQEWSYTSGTIDVYSLMLKQTVTSGVVRYNFSMVNASTAYNDVLVLDRGNVGIGTTSPSYLLDVNGSGRIGSGIGTGVYVGNTSHAVWTRTGGTNGNMALYSGGSDRITIVGDTGNVGIGTTSPAYKLDVTGDINFTNTLKFGGVTVISNSGADVYANIRVIRNESTALNDGMYIGYNNSGGASGHLRFYANGTNERMRIDASNGNVGIGTTAPSNPLHVEKDAGGSAIAYFNSLNADGYGVAIRTADTGNDKYVLRLDSNSGSTPVMYATNGGNVGIGTTAPANKLDVRGIARILSDDSINAKILYYTASPYGMIFRAYGSGANSIQVQREADDAELFPLVLQPNGSNVGIGTTAPSAKLEVYAGSNSTANTILWGQTIRNAGNAATTGYGAGLKLKNSTDAAPNELYKWAGVASVAGSNYSDRTDLAFYTNAGVIAEATEKVRITGDGNLGIGTIAPGAPLSVAGVGGSTKGTNGYLVNIGGTDGDVDPVRYMIGFTHGNTYTAANVRAAVGMMVTTGGAGNLVFETGTSGAGQLERMRINGSGDVGINNSTPSYKLDVTGDVRITSGSLGVGVVPNATDGRIDASNDIVAFSTSDERFKENITPIANALEKVKTLTGVEFDWRKETKDYHGYVGHDVGVIAQQVKAVLPEAVRTNANGYLAVRYEKIIGLLIEANKELAARVEELESKLK
jgi:hypothetical protein